MTISDSQLPFVFSLLIIPWWIFISFLISRAGWHAFAKKYPCLVPPPGTSFNCRTAQFGNILASYRNVMRVRFCTEGVYIHAMFLFRAFHPSFLVPWSSVAGVAAKKIFFVSYHELEIQDAAGRIHILLSTEALRDYRRFEATHSGLHRMHPPV